METKGSFFIIAYLPGVKEADVAVSIDRDHVQAHLANGVLCRVLPKAKEAQPRRIAGDGAFATPRDDLDSLTSQTQVIPRGAVDHAGLAVIRTATVMESAAVGG